MAPRPISRPSSALIEPELRALPLPNRTSSDLRSSVAIGGNRTWRGQPISVVTDELIEFVSKMRGDAYGNGYADGICDERFAQELKARDAPASCTVTVKFPKCIDGKNGRFRNAVICCVMACGPYEAWQDRKKTRSGRRVFYECTSAACDFAPSNCDSLLGSILTV